MKCTEIQDRNFLDGARWRIIIFNIQNNSSMISIAISPIDLNHYHQYLPQERQLRMKREER